MRKLTTCQVKDHAIPVGPDHQKRRRSRRVEMSAAERRQERDVRILRLFSEGWTEADVVILTGLTLKQVRNRVAAMAAAERAMRHGE